MLLVLMCIQPRVLHFVCLSCLVLHVVCAVLPEFEFKTFRDDVVYHNVPSFTLHVTLYRKIIKIFPSF